MPALRTRDTQSRSLEVTTDAPLPPTLAIISPTPRAFTFPINHNLTDSPYSSPSHSPFEPDHRSLPSTCITPPTFMRTLSPSSSLTSVSPSPSTHKRRKSTTSEADRRPKKGDEDYIKRPENAFILFRRKCCEERQQAQDESTTSPDGPTKKQRQADLSKTISQQWKGLTAEDRQYWEQLAKEKKKEHEQMYPNYVYRPQRSKDKDGKPKSRKPKGRRGEFDHETDSESLSFVVPMGSYRHHGRSASAPTPPLPYQAIQLPNVYLNSCPTSPSLLPMISRRSSHPGHPEDALSNFDYLPSESLMPPSFGQAGQFEASLQSSEFFRGMFNMSGQQATPMADRSAMLPPLTTSHEPSLLLPAHQIISPSSSIGSGSSGPSSPNTGPFTPTANMLAYSFSQLNPSDTNYDGCAQQQPQFNMQMEMQLQDLEYSSYSWENNSVWPGEANMMFGDDFDLNAIPPIALGLAEFGNEGCTSSLSDAGLPEYNQGYNPGDEDTRFTDEVQDLDGLLGFDELMAGHGF